jgi:hypothetical protein
VDAVLFPRGNFQWWMQGHSGASLALDSQVRRVAAGRPGVGGLCIIR